MREDVDDGWQKRCGVARGRWRWRHEVSSRISSLHFFRHLHSLLSFLVKKKDWGVREFKIDKLLLVYLLACLLPFGCGIR